MKEILALLSLSSKANVLNSPTMKLIDSELEFYIFRN